MKWLFVILITLSMAGCPPLINPGQPPAPPRIHNVETNHYFLIENVQRTLIDIRPIWDLGRVGLKPGHGEVLHLTRTISYPDKDDDFRVIPGSLRDRRVYHLWIDIPTTLAIDEWLDVSNQGGELLTAEIDVDELNGNGRLVSHVILKGTVKKHIDQSDYVVFEVDLDIKPGRPFLGQPWKLNGLILAKKDAAAPYFDASPKDGTTN